MKTSYDKSTDSLYVEVRPLPSCRTVEIEQDIMLDIGSDETSLHYSYRRELRRDGMVIRERSWQRRYPRDGH